MKILIVEDEAKTGDYLKQGLAEAGFAADLVRNGLSGIMTLLVEPACDECANHFEDILPLVDQCAAIE